jgi:hypothetical protein
MNRDDLPFRAMAAMGEVVYEVAEEVATEVANKAVQAHVEEYVHEKRLEVPPRPPLKAIPFKRDHIPGEILERMVEVFETEPEADLHQVAQRFGYPPSLVLRELADHKANFGRFCFMRAQS